MIGWYPNPIRAFISAYGANAAGNGGGGGGYSGFQVSGTIWFEIL